MSSADARYSAGNISGHIPCTIAGPVLYALFSGVHKACTPTQSTEFYMYATAGTPPL